MSPEKYLNPDNLHHAYLIEGEREEVVPSLEKFLEKNGIKISGNADFVRIHLDALKIDDARSIKVYSSEMGVTTDKRIFLIAANSILEQAQNSLLKLIEEPIANTHFFIVVPDLNSLLKTFISRFYVIADEESGRISEQADKFITMTARERIDWLKEYLADTDEVQDSARARAIKFLNNLELILHQKFVSKSSSETEFFGHIFNVRKHLRMPGSSAKNLLESVALIVPTY